MRNVFNKASSPARKFLIIAFVAVSFMLIDSFTPWMKPIYSAVDNFVRPIYWLSNIPLRLEAWSENAVVPRSEL